MINYNRDDAQNIDEEKKFEKTDNERKQSRCIMCDRNKDQKSQTICHKDGLFACANHHIIFYKIYCAK